MSEPSIWLRPRGAVYRGVSGAGSSEIVNPLVVDTTMSRVESDLFYESDIFDASLIYQETMRQMQ